MTGERIEIVCHSPKNTRNFGWNVSGMLIWFAQTKISPDKRNFLKCRKGRFQIGFYLHEKCLQLKRYKTAVSSPVNHVTLKMGEGVRIVTIVLELDSLISIGPAEINCKLLLVT